jgi:ribosomal protein S12 methylthiotransferase
VLPYLDIPFQHAAPNVLKAMKRPANEEKTLARIKSWRAACPDLTLRSTFIVGFPGETEEDFQILLDWLDEAEIDRAGAFKYEPVAGAPANDLGLALVPDEVKESRWKRFMEKQQAVSAKLMKRKVGKRLQVIIDEAGGGPAGGPARGRTKSDAPQIDGAAVVESRRPLRPGDMVTMKVARADAYDVYGEAV